MTRVSLTRIAGRLDVRLRFGRPAHVLKVDDQRRIALFAPGAIFCRLRWMAETSDVQWELLVIMAACAGERLEKVSGITPPVHVLVRAEGERRVRQVQQRIACIGTLGVDPTEASPAYWRSVQRRLMAGLPLPEYSIERHAVHLAGRGAR